MVIRLYWVARIISKRISALIVAESIYRRTSRPARNHRLGQSTPLHEQFSRPAGDRTDGRKTDQLHAEIPAMAEH